MDNNLPFWDFGIKIYLKHQFYEVFSDTAFFFIFC